LVVWLSSLSWCVSLLVGVAITLSLYLRDLQSCKSYRSGNRGDVSVIVVVAWRRSKTWPILSLGLRWQVLLWL